MRRQHLQHGILSTFTDRVVFEHLASVAFMLLCRLFLGCVYPPAIQVMAY